MGGRSPNIATYHRVRGFCDMLDECPDAWPLYAEHFREFIDSAESLITELRINQERLRGSTKGVSLRARQMFHKERLWRERPHKCERCGCALIWKTYTVHHIIPVKDGGSFDDDNLQMLCRTCHKEVEHQKTIDRWYGNIVSEVIPDSELEPSPIG